MARVQSETEKTVAVLHDIIEDTDYTIENLRENVYSKEILEAIDCLTKRDGEDYDDYVNRSMSNPIANKVDVPVKKSLTGRHSKKLQMQGARIFRNKAYLEVRRNDKR